MGRGFASTRPLSPSLPPCLEAAAQHGRVEARGARVLLAAAAPHLTAAVFLLVQVEVSAVIRCLGEAHGGCAVAVTDEHLALVVGAWRGGWAVRALRGALPRVARLESCSAPQDSVPAVLHTVQAASLWHYSWQGLPLHIPPAPKATQPHAFQTGKAQ